jgi:uncharacterized membrane protein
MIPCGIKQTPVPFHRLNRTLISTARAANITRLMSAPQTSAAENPRRIVIAAAVLFALATTAVSSLRWAAFQYRTFDLAFYVQALWQSLRGRFDVSLLNVPLLGNHAEPVVFFIAPLFAIFPNSMLLVAVQNIALALLAPVGYGICRRLGLDDKKSTLLAVATLLAPATGFVALHEFHPEAFSPLFLLLMFDARLRRSAKLFWLWFFFALGCKENIALLLAAYGAVHALLDRKHAIRWGVLPMLAACAWLLFYSGFLGPLLNHGNVDYGALYSHLNASPRGIFAALFHALREGNLLWATLLPFLALPLLRPRWLVIAAPVLLQHLLSWRSSEWQVWFHYGAPLVALFWMATAEAVAKRADIKPLAALVVAACFTAQLWIGPLKTTAASIPETADAFDAAKNKSEMLAHVPHEASALASLAFLPHLAKRETLFSLHHVLKGLKTLSRADYEPPPATDAVLIDFDDAATFDADAGYYHPKMQTQDGRVIPSSDRLLHQFLRQATWKTESLNSVTLFTRANPVKQPPAEPQQAVAAEIDAHTRLVSITASGDSFSHESPLTVRMVWNFRGEREIFPWLILKMEAVDGSETKLITKGLCAADSRDDGSNHEENWRVVPPPGMRPGVYKTTAIFVDNTARAWKHEASGAASPGFVLELIDLGKVRAGNPQ